MNSKITKILILGFVLAAAQAPGQGNNGRGKCMQPFGISFYSIKGGYEDEWLALYMQWHYPLMEYALQHGTVLEHKLFVPDGHGADNSWTFAVSFLFPSAQERSPAPLDRQQQIEQLFGDRMDDYVAGEKRRWELTVRHWDIDFVELDKTENPLSVYLPSAGGCR